MIAGLKVKLTVKWFWNYGASVTCKPVTLM